MALEDDKGSGSPRTDRSSPARDRSMDKKQGERQYGVRPNQQCCSPSYERSNLDGRDVMLASHLKNFIEQSARETKKEERKFIGRLGCSFSNWNKRPRCESNLWMDANSKLLKGLPGGGGCSSCCGRDKYTSPTNYTSLNLTADPVIQGLRSIEKGIKDGQNDLILGGIEQIKNWEGTQRPLDAAVEFVDLLCSPTSQGLPYILKESMIEKLPILLFLILRDPNFRFTKDSFEEMTEKVSNLEIKLEMVGGLEIEYFKELSLMIFEEFPQPKTWKDFAQNLKDLVSLGKALFNPYDSIEIIQSLYSLSQKVYSFFKKQEDSLNIAEYVRIQYLELGILNNDQESIEEFERTAKESEKVFVKKICLICAKQLMMNIGNCSNFKRLEDLVFEMFEDDDIQNMVIRVCLEVGSLEYSSALDFIEEKKKLLIDTEDVLKKNLLLYSHDIQDELSLSNINWGALKGISYANYKNVMNGSRELCKETDIVYIDLEGSESPASEAESFPLLETVMKFLKDSKLKVFVLLGDSGSGKTHFCYRLMRHLLETYNDYLPLYGDLPLIVNRKNDFAGFTLKNYDVFDITKEIASRKLLFILDSYNEINEKVNLIEFNQFFHEFKECKVIITCRAQEVNTLDNFVRYLGDIPKRAERKIFYIQPFSSKQIKEYIRKVREKPNQETDKVKASLEEIWGQIKSIPKLKKMLDSPFMLKICLNDLNLLYKIDEENLTRFSLYHEFMKSYHENNINKLNLRRGLNTILDEYFSACTYFAFQVLKKGKIDANDKIAKKNTSIKKGCPLRGVSFGANGEATHLTFIHNSICEFYIALRFKDIFEEIYTKDEENFTPELLDQFNEILIIEEDNILSFIQDYLTQEHKDTLIRILLLRRPDCEIASANSITILNYSGYSFMGMDLTGIQIQGADLSGAILTRANLSGSNMKGVKLIDACLDFANLCDCDLREVSFREWVPLKSHNGEVYSVSFSPHGRMLASGSSDNTVSVWDLQGSQMKPIYTFEGHTSRVLSVSFSPDGELLASGSKDATVCVWNFQQSQPIHIFNAHTSGVCSVSFSEDKELLAAGYQDKKIRIWGLQTSKIVCDIKAHSDAVSSVSFSPDRRLLASGSADNTVKIWDFEGSEAKLAQTFQAHSGAVSSVCFSKDGRFVASGSWDQTVIVWDIETYQAKYTLKDHTRGVCSVSFSGDGALLASGSADRTVRIWDLQESHSIPACTLQAHYGEVSSVSFSEDGRFVASGSWDKTIRIWDLQSSKMKQSFQAHSAPVSSVSFSSDDSFLVSGSHDKTLKVWNLQTLQKTHTLKGHSRAVSSLSLSKDGKRVVSGSWDQTVRVWDLETSQTTQVLEDTSDHYNSVHSVSLSEDGNLVAAGYLDTAIKVWDLEGSQRMQSLQASSGNHNQVFSVDFSRDGRLLATSSNDRTVKIWNLETSQIVNVLQDKSSIKKDDLYPAVYAVKFSRDSQLVASGSYDNKVRVWNLQRFKMTHSLQAESEHSDNTVYSISFSEDTRLIASANDDKTVRVWDLETSREVYRITAHSSPVLSVSFSSDGRFLVSGGRDNTVKVWDLQGVHIDLNESSQELESTNLSVSDSFSRPGKSDLELSRDITHQFAFSSDGKVLVELNENKILRARDISTGEEVSEYLEGANISDYPDLILEVDPKLPILPLYAQFSNGLQAYGALFNNALLSKRNLELLLYKRYHLK